MRDIRSDLEERAHIIHEQLRAADAWFEKVMQKLQNERDAKVSDLKGTLAMIDKLMQFEARAMDKVVTLENPPAPQRSIIDRISGGKRQLGLSDASYGRMAEQFASGQMLHLHNKLRVAPLSIRQP